MLPLTTRRAALAGAAALAAATVVPEAPARALTRGEVALRRKFFGRRNVDATGRVRKDRVILSWFGVTGYAMAIHGRVLLLDAWVPRGEYAGVVPTDPEELAALRPSHLLLGHGHFDHAADAATIATASGATLLGTPEHVAQVRKQAGAPIRARALGPEKAAYGAVGSFRIGKRLRLTAVRHPHSAAKMPQGGFPPVTGGLGTGLGTVLTHPPSPQDGLHELSHLGDAEGGCLLYRFRLGRFVLTWHDTSGPIRTDAPQVQQWLRRQTPSTVQLGAIQGFGMYTNGLRDPVDYVRAIRPRILVPGHHDNWAPPVTGPGGSYAGPLRDALATLPESQRPAVRLLRDPDDYVRPSRLTFGL